MAFRAILVNFLEEQSTQTQPQSISGLSRARFPTVFLEIVCQYLSKTAILETEVSGRNREVVLVALIVNIDLTYGWVQTRILPVFLILIPLMSPSFCHSVCFLCGVPLVTCYAMRSHCTSSCKLKYLRRCTFLVLKVSVKENEVPIEKKF